MKLPFLAAVALAACVATGFSVDTLAAEPAPSGDTPNAGSTSRKAAIGAFGLDLTAGNSSVKAGDDFFLYSNGAWYDKFQIPDDRSAFGIFHELDEQARERVRQIIEEAAASKPAKGSPEQKIGDFYASFIDEKAIEANGLKPARTDLAKIDAAKTKKDVATLFGLPGYASTFSISLPADLMDPNKYSVVIGQAGLGLPDRDYYLKDDPKLVELRTKYVAYIEQMLGLANVSGGAEKAKAIMAFETAIANASWPIEQRRDVEATYNPRKKSDVLTYAPGFEWQVFFDAAEIGKRNDLVLSELTAVRDLAKLVGETPVDTLKSYLTFHYLSDHAAYLPKRFDDARFAFYGQTMRGQPKQRERWKRAVDQVNAALGEQVGQVYVRKYFPPESKAKMDALVTNLRGALRERIDTLDWMTPETKKRAQEKLSTFVSKIGYPEKWKDYTSLEVQRDDLIGNVRRASLFDWRFQVARLDKPVDKAEWQLNPQDINAYYYPPYNEIVFPAAILSPPFFDPNADAAVNYGAIGAVIGHEIGHGFDDQGRKFAPDGSLTDWWTEADSKAFEARANKLVQQYGEFEPLAGLKVNGANTLGENIGDLGGLNMAYHAYRRSLNGAEPPVIGGLTGDQRFFLSWAQVWRAKYREGSMRELVMSDVHSPPYFRVNGPVRNMKEWYSAFGVKPGDKLYIKPEDRVSIW